MKRFCLILLVAASASYAAIPVLDMEEYYDPDTQDKFVGELYDALKEVGVFALINTGVDPDILDRAYQSCFDFFALPMDEKMKVCVPGTRGQRGYVLGDFKEFYHVGREASGETLKALGLRQNVWPDEINLRKPLNRLFRELEDCMLPLEMAMAEAIGISSEFFMNMTKNGDLLLRAIRDSASPSEGERTDIDLFTILSRPTADGLQVKNKEGQWVDVKVPENAFIVSSGDMLENITNGEFRSGLYRTIAKEDGYSIAFFIHPRAQCRLDPLPSCITRTGGVRKYPAASRQELLAERLTEDLSMLEFLSNSGLMERQIELGRPSVDAMKKLKEAGLASSAVLAELDYLEK